MDTEIWKDIPNFYGYQASNLGNIRTHNKTTYTVRHGVRHWKDRVLKPKWQIRNKNRKGKIDGRVELWRNGKHYTKLVSRLVASAFLGESDLTVNHIDGNPLNNSIKNLEYVTIKENIQKGFENGLYKNCKKIEITNIKNNEKKVFYSMSKASQYISHNCGYISNMLKKGKTFNKNYRWKIYESQVKN